MYLYQKQDMESYKLTHTILEPNLTNSKKHMAASVLAHTFSFHRRLQYKLLLFMNYPKKTFWLQSHCEGKYRQHADNRKGKVVKDTLKPNKV